MKRWSLILACLALGGILGAYAGRPFLLGQPSARPAVPRELTSYRDIVKKMLPAVVSLEALAKPGKAPRRRPDDTDLPEGRRPEAAPRRVADGPARVGFGSGFLVSARGVILTNNHVVEDADQVVVQLLDGRKFLSKDIKTDPKTDLAIIRLDAKDSLPFLELGDSEAMEIGDRVLAVGAPFGLTGSVTHGIISGKGRSLRMNMYEDFLQTDAAINPGNSGGPLVNLEGKVVGISSAIKSRTGGFQGVGLAISSNLAKAIMEQLLRDGVVRRGYLGVGIRDVKEDEAGKLGLKEPVGVFVTQVLEGTPGARAKMKVGDVLLTIAGKPVKDGRQLQTLVAGLPLGKPVSAQVLRGGKLQNLKITVEEQPPEFGTIPDTRRAPEPSRGVAIEGVGLSVADLTDELAGSFGFKESARGVVVTRVERGGLADNAGVKPGLLIVAVDRTAVSSLKELREAFRSVSLSRGFILKVQDSAGKSRQVLIQGE